MHTEIRSWALIIIPAVCFLLALSCLAASESPPEQPKPAAETVDGFSVLLEDLVSDDPVMSQNAASHLRELCRQRPRLMEDLLIKLRQQTGFLMEGLGVQSDEDERLLFFKEKYRQAMQLYQRKAYEKAARLCTALLDLGVPSPLKHRVTRCQAMAREREFADKILHVDLLSEREIYEGRESIALKLEVLNRADNPVRLRFPVGITLAISITTISPTGRIIGREETKRLSLLSEPVELDAGKVLTKSFSMDLDLDRAPFVIKRIRLKGTIRRAMVTIDGRRFDRSLGVPGTEVLLVSPGQAMIQEDPMAQLRKAVADGDGHRLFLATVLAVWKDQHEQVFETLLKAARKPALSEVSYLLLRLLTGENFNRDRERWVSYYLGRKSLFSDSPLLAW